MRLLLVEDDPMLGKSLQQALQAQQYLVDWVQTGIAALSALQAEHFDLALMDLGLPGLDGVRVIEEVRSQKMPLPILILTARDSVQDKIRGLDAGADDYLLKPFDLNELFARLRALGRRGGVAVANELQYGDIVLDLASHDVRYQGQLVSLSRRELRLLEVFLGRPGQVFTRQQLEQAMYGWGEEVESNALEVHIHHLRKKFFNDIILTVRGVGYRLNTGIAM
ncbi:response regulator transcription factor [Thalassolituus sp. ST750PaO-4]|uniref:response regulator n=1 Tax=Thalassolituus sp. ST750PaO-4 TaxID=2742965 RepID=UPI001CE3ACDE|nr:response regulator transcription factor [Thalassolituus sp. ST750PaO-4]MCA6059068.1 response regulator transcription factor [Thalassolituus sp. ST750PaO-4]